MRSPVVQWICALAPAGAMLIASACRGGESAAPVAAPPAFEPLSVAMIRDETLQPDIKMLAWAEGDTVSMEIQSLTQTPIFVEARNFGIIHERLGQRIVQFDPQVHTARFPKVGLEFGQRASGELRFNGMGELSGQRLVFHHTHTRPSVAIIQGINAPNIAVPVGRSIPTPVVTPIPDTPAAPVGAAPTPLPLAP